MPRACPKNPRVRTPSKKRDAQNRTRIKNCGLVAFGGTMARPNTSWTPYNSFGSRDPPEFGLGGPFLHKTNVFQGSPSPSLPLLGKMVYPGFGVPNGPNWTLPEAKGRLLLANRHWPGPTPWCMAPRIWGHALGIWCPASEIWRQVIKGSQGTPLGKKLRKKKL